MGGTAALIIPTTTASATPTPITMGGMDKPGTTFDASGKTNIASRSPNKAAAAHTTVASVIISKNTVRSEKPSVLSTASSGVLSRSDCIIIVAVANSSATSTAATMAR